MIMVRDLKRYCSWKQLVLTAELKKCALYTASHGALTTRSLSDYFLRYAGIDLNAAITGDYCCTKRVTFSYNVEEYHTAPFHTQLPQNQYLNDTTPKPVPHLNDLHNYHEHALYKIYL